MEKVQRILARLVVKSSVKLPNFSAGVYIYGAGELGLLAIEYCEACQIPIIGVVDKNKTGMIKGGKGEYAIRNPIQITDWDRGNIPIAVAVATEPFTPIAKFLNSLGWSTVLPFYSLTRENRIGHPLCNGWVIDSVSEEELVLVARICESWADELSLLHYEAFLAWHVDGSELVLPNHSIEPSKRYAIEPLRDFLSVRHKQFVDVGSHRGGAVRRLCNAGFFFDEYFLIEPDAMSRNDLSCIADQLRKQGKLVTILSDVVGSRREIIFFQEGLGYCSQIWRHSLTPVVMLPVDELGLNPDFIKVHTEGSELNVLRGAQKTIQASSSAFVFSVYHSRNGFCADIACAMELFSEYQWYFRLHDYQGTGAFVYAIPL